MARVSGRSVYEDLLSEVGSRSLREVGEKELLGRFLLPLCRAACGDRGLGDDAAVLELPRGSVAVLSCDRVPTDLIALELGLMSHEQLGRYIVRVNVSDLVAMAADPVGMVLSAAFPPTTPLVSVLELMWGCYDESAALGCPVVGGDTKSARETSVSATVLGACPAGRTLPRGPLRPGDGVWVTGPVGTVNAALRWFTHDRQEQRPTPPPEVERELRSRLLEPSPRVDLVPALRETAAIVAGMDITDGLGSSLFEIAAGSSVGIRIDEPSLPTGLAGRWVAGTLGIQTVDLAAGIGNDLELLLALRPDNEPPFPAHRIGTVTAEPGVRLGGGAATERPFPLHGFEHFSRTARDQITGEAASP